MSERGTKEEEIKALLETKQHMLYAKPSIISELSPDGTS